MQRIIPFFLVLAVLAASALGQTITSPTSGQTITGFRLALTGTSWPAGAEHVIWSIDGRQVCDPVRVAPFTCVWDPYLDLNGSQKQVVATAYDLANNILGTSPTVTFTALNAIAEGSFQGSDSNVWTPGLAVSCNPADGATWIATVVCTGIISGTHPSGVDYSLFVDGATNGVGGSANVLTLDTTQWPNGTHYVCFTANNGDFNNIWAQSCRTETFQNTGLAIGLIGQGRPLPTLGGTNCTGTNGVSTSFTCQPGAAISPGLPFAVSFISQASGVDISTVSGCSVTPTEVITSGVHTRASVMFCPAASETTNILTVALTGTCSGWCNANLVLLEGVGIATDAAQALSGTGTSMVTGALTTTNPADFLLAVAAGNAGCTNGQSALPNGFIALNVSDNNCDRSQMAYKIQSSAGAESTTFTSGTSQSYDTVIVAFKRATTPAPVNYLTLSNRTDTLCVSASTLCPTAVTLTGIYNRADSTTTVATIACVSGNTAVLTISGSCAETAIAGGTALITATATNSMTRPAWTSVPSSNVAAHFGSDGKVYNTWTSGKSIFLNSMFYSTLSLTYLNTPLVRPAYLTNYLLAGWNAIEPAWEYNGLGASSWQGVAQTTFNPENNTYESGWCTFAQTNGLYLHVSGNSWFPPPGSFYTTRGTVADNMHGTGVYSPAGTTYLATLWGGCNRVVGAWLNDEVQQVAGGFPFQPAPQLGVNVSSIACSGGSCTVHFAGPYSLEVPTGPFIVVAGGTSTGGLTLNSAAGTVYSPTAITSSSFAFACAGCTTGTYTGSTDPGMIVELAAYTWFLSNTDYPRWNFVQQIMSDYLSATNPPCQTWPNSAQTSPFSVVNWQYDPRVACHSGYYVNDNFTYLASSRPAALAIGGTGDHVRGGNGTGLTTANLAIPVTILTQPIVTDYGLQGASVSLLTCVGNTLTFSVAHGVSNVIAYSTRVQVTGSTGCDGNYWVIAAPTSTTLTVWTLYNGNISASSGTIAFPSDGHSFSINSLATSTSTTIYSNQTVGVLGASPWLACEAGRTFTFSGTGTALDSGVTGYLPYNNPALLTANCSTLDHGGTFAQWGLVPTLSSTGGTGQVIPNNYFVSGRNSVFPLTGPVFEFSRSMYLHILGASGQRGYVYADAGYDPQDWNTQASSQNGYFATGPLNLNQNFGSGSTGAITEQFGAIPGTGFQPTDDHWWAGASANYLLERPLKYSYQPTLPAPDYNPFMESVAHQGAYGNMQSTQSFLMGPATLVSNLSACDVPGQQKIKYLFDYTGGTVTTLSSGTMSDSSTLPAGGFVMYLCPDNAAAELIQPTVSVRLADISGATGYAVRYGYLPYWVDNGTHLIDCGSAGICVIPADPQIATVLGRIIYYKVVAGVKIALATTDIQPL